MTIIINEPLSVAATHRLLRALAESDWQPSSSPYREVIVVDLVTPPGDDLPVIFAEAAVSLHVNRLVE